MRRLFALLFTLLLPVPAMTADLPPLLTYQELSKRPTMSGDVRIAYGPAPQQFGELWLPKGNGPHPLVVLVHGGCWLAEYAGFDLMGPMSAALRDQGIAVWNIEYRKLGEAGAGYPGTFQDVAAAVDHVRTLAGTYPLDLNRVVLSGHSAGGHLALWAAGRSNLPADSAVRGKDPLRVRGVVSLAGIIDLRDYHARGPDACGGPGTIDRLIDSAGRTGNPFADTSPGEAPVKELALTLVSGTRDHIVPPSFAQHYAAKAQGPELRELEIDGAGHFELVTPQTDAWAVIQAEIRDRLR